MKDFDIEKKKCLEKLYKIDKSRKGNLDEKIIPLIEYINSLKDFYTTSSCSGRIYILTEANKKPDVKWIYVSHEKVDENTIIDSLINNCPKIKNRIWFRQENLILHVACRNMESANALLKIARDVGLKRSGIIADSNIIIVEICSTEKIDVPLSENGKLLVNKNYIKFLTKIANQKFEKGQQTLKTFEIKVKETFNKP